MRQQGVAVTQAQVRQAAEQSGWLRLHQTLTEQYTVDKHGLRLRDEWLVAQLTAQVQALLTLLEADQALPLEQRLAINDLLTLTTAAGPRRQRRTKRCPGCCGSNSWFSASGKPLTMIRCVARPAARRRLDARAPHPATSATTMPKAKCRRWRSTATTVATDSVSSAASLTYRPACCLTPATAAKSICWPCRCMPGATPPTAAPAWPWGSPA